MGYALLEGHFHRDVAMEMASAFEPIYQANLDTIRNDPNRGPMRHYIVLPFEPPLYQSAFHGNSAVLAIATSLRQTRRRREVSIRSGTRTQP